MAVSPWLVPVTALRRSRSARQVENRQGQVGELKVAASVVTAGSSAEAQVVLDCVDGGIEVTGTVSAPWVGECRRCLRPVGGRLEVFVRELYRPRPLGERPEEDEETYPLEGELLDLAPLVRDALLLELPLAPLCRQGCLGLCVRCGADLNEGSCQCAGASVDPRWAALDALRGPGRHEDR